MHAPKIATRSDLRTAAGHALICGFAGTTFDAEMREVLDEVRPIGVILFARNIESPEACYELVRELKDYRRADPLLVTVDQEGGRVARIKSPATEWPPMREVARLDDRELVCRVGAALGEEIRALGFDIDYAPVLDVDTNPANPIIGDRAFGSDAYTTSEFAAAFLAGLNSAGVGGCGKHFPGHGDTDVDSHLALPRVEHELPLLREREWAPYRRLIAAGLDAIMTAHIVVPAIDDTVPATLSPALIRTLRGELGFRGIIMSDDVEMKALADHYEPSEITDRGVRAGLDLYLACNRYEVTLETFRGIVHAYEQGAISHDEILQREKRVQSWRDRWYREAPEATVARAAIGKHINLAAECNERLAMG